MTSDDVLLVLPPFTLQSFPASQAVCFNLCSVLQSVLGMTWCMVCVLTPPCSSLTSPCSP
jgi:hypothetical protein